MAGLRPDPLATMREPTSMGKGLGWEGKGMSEGREGEESKEMGGRVGKGSM